MDETEKLKMRRKEQERTEMDDLYCISRQEATQFRTKYIKAMSLSNSIPRQQISSTTMKEGFSLRRREPRERVRISSIAVFGFIPTHEEGIRQLKVHLWINT